MGDPLGQRLPGVLSGILALERKLLLKHVQKTRLHRLPSGFRIAAHQDVGGGHGGVGTTPPIPALDFLGGVHPGLEVIPMAHVAVGGVLSLDQAIEFPLLPREQNSTIESRLQFAGIAQRHHTVLQVLPSDQVEWLFQALQKFRRGLLLQLLALVQLPLPGFGTLFPGFRIETGTLVLSKGKVGFTQAEGGKEGLGPVVVASGNGVVLVVVTASALQGEPQKDRSGGGDQIDQQILPPGVLSDDPQIEEPESEFALRAVNRIQIAGQLLLDKTVVSAVLIESANDVVPVAPDVGTRVVGATPFGIGVANQIEPVPAPTLPVVGIAQQFLDFLLIGGLARVAEKPCHGFRSGGHAGQIEIDPAQQGPSGSRRRRLHPLFLQLGQDQGVDGVSHPVPVSNCRDVRRLQAGEGPGRSLSL